MQKPQIPFRHESQERVVTCSLKHHLFGSESSRGGKYVGSFGHLEEVGEVDKANRPNNLFEDLKRHRVKRHGIWCFVLDDDAENLPISFIADPQNPRKI